MAIVSALQAQQCCFPLSSKMLVSKPMSSPQGLLHGEQFLLHGEQFEATALGIA